MDPNNKRKPDQRDTSPSKKAKKECSYGVKCYRRNPTHFRDFGHQHLEQILDNSEGDDFDIPNHLTLQRQVILDQLKVIKQNNLYTPKAIVLNTTQPVTSKDSTAGQLNQNTNSNINQSTSSNDSVQNIASTSSNSVGSDKVKVEDKSPKIMDVIKADTRKADADKSSFTKQKASDYRPIIPPTRSISEFFKVVAPKGNMAAKLVASAPYNIFYTTITDARATHTQPYSVTFQELLDPSLGELKCSLQINFMVDAGWLLAQYYFAGYSGKKLTILYGDDAPDLRDLHVKKPHIDAHHIKMASPFGTHHTKMMFLCYEDGSLRVVISTANLYIDDWENRTQGLWISPPCPELPETSMPHEGDSPTMFKRSLLKYLNHYHMSALSYYVERVKRCDFSHVNVFLVTSVPGSHFDQEFGLTRVGSLLRQHCSIPAEDHSNWPLHAQASSLGSFGQDPKLWLTGDFLHHFTRVKNQPNIITQKPEFKLIYPSLENVKKSHDGILGGGCLPYSGEVNKKQPWLREYLYQWRAIHTNRDQAMPHIKTYTRVNNSTAAFYLLTSANISKAAWGSINKGNAALRIMNYEAGVLFIPQFVINKDYFSLNKNDDDVLVIPYDIPPVKYTEDMRPWVSDYLM